MSPNQRETISAQSTITGKQEYLSSTNNILNVNATFSASAIALQDGANSSIKATVLSLTDSKPLTVAIVNGTGDQITSFGGGTQYTNGSSQATPTGTVALGYDGTAVRALSTDTSGRQILGASTQGVGNVGTISAAVNVGQKTVSTTAVQVSASSTVPQNGILIEALSTNSASIFVGGTGVLTTTGFELQPGQSAPFTCNLNTLFIVSAASTTDKVCWNVA